MNRRNPMSGIYRFVHWQFISRLVKSYEHSWLSGIKLIVSRGMTGATGNIYCGLHEFVEMAFFLHAAKPGDKFLDIGANIGSYSMLLAGCRGAECVAFEPHPKTASYFLRNVAANNLDSLIKLKQVALTDKTGEVHFTSDRDTTNQIAASRTTNTIVVGAKRLDDIPDARNATFIKIDIEGHEVEAMAGGKSTIFAPSVLAILIELNDETIKQKMAAHGFFQVYYDPRTRTLSKSPSDDLSSANTIYARDIKVLQKRIQLSPPIRYRGVEL